MLPPRWITATPGTVSEDGKDLALILGGLRTSFRENGLIRHGKKASSLFGVGKAG